MQCGRPCFIDLYLKSIFQEPEHKLFTSEFPEIKSLVDVIEKRQELFHPTVKVVRLFEDGDQKFVMKAEIDYILNKTKDDTEIRFLHTMGMEEAERTLGKNTFEVLILIWSQTSKKRLRDSSQLLHRLNLLVFSVTT